MNSSEEMDKQSPPKWRLLRALGLMGHPKIKPLACWLFFIPQLLIYLYLLGPVFVYYTKGVPAKESLEVITGTWREVGKWGSNRNGLVAPLYFVDTESGPRKVHCGFPMQKRLCSVPFGSRINTGQRVRVYFDSYFGVLAFEHLDAPEKYILSINLSYEQGVSDYAQPRHIFFKNYGAHYMIFFWIAAYLVIVYSCWTALRKTEVGEHE